jgi:hypothetical protein
MSNSIVPNLAVAFAMAVNSGRNSYDRLVKKLTSKG